MVEAMTGAEATERLKGGDLVSADLVDSEKISTTGGGCLAYCPPYVGKSSGGRRRAVEHQGRGAS